MDLAARAALDKLATDLVALDVSEHLALTDAFVICSGATNGRWTRLWMRSSARCRVSPSAGEGKGTGRWVLLDFGDFVGTSSTPRSGRSTTWSGCGRTVRASRYPMSEPRRLVLWRHGRTAWNLEHRFQGQTDVALDEVGVRQARAAAGLLMALRPQLIVSSDLSRAVTPPRPWPTGRA